VPVIANNDVIQEFDLEKLSGFDQVPCCFDVAFAGCRITAWMIVLCGALIYVEFNSGTAQKGRFEPFRRGCLLHITTTSKARSVYRGPAAKWDRDFFFQGAVFQPTGVFCVSFPDRSRHTRSWFQWKRGRAMIGSY
jgi:hypothetical protein